MAHEGDGAGLRATLQHEATHRLMSVDQSRQPAWFSEGIAEMFSTFERQGDKVNWAKPIGPYLVLLQNATLEPLAQFLVEPGARHQPESPAIDLLRAAHGSPVCYREAT